MIFVKWTSVFVLVCMSVVCVMHSNDAADSVIDDNENDNNNNNNHDVSE